MQLHEEVNLIVCVCSRRNKEDEIPREDLRTEVVKIFNIPQETSFLGLRALGGVGTMDHCVTVAPEHEELIPQLEDHCFDPEVTGRGRMIGRSG